MASRTPTVPPPAPPRDPSRYGGGRGGWALLCTVGDRYEAELIRGLLEGEGLGPVVVDPVHTIGAWMLPSGHANMPQRVIVLAAVLDAAKLALLEAGFDEGALDVGEPADEEPMTSRRPRGAVVRWVLIVAFASAVLSYLWQLMRGEAGIP